MAHQHASDFLIVGGGILGLTTAWQLKKKFPRSHIALLEKESRVASHASGRNSGVIHAGFYYSANSLKAQLTVRGNQLLKSFCHSHHIPVNHCGKVVVAQTENEVAVIDDLHQRGKANGVVTQIISSEELKEIEANAKTVEKALYSPSTASVDPKAVCLKLYDLLKEKGVHFFLGERLTRCVLPEGIAHTSKGHHRFGYLINCGGVYADKIAQKMGFGRQYTIMPFRGNYLKYTGKDKPITTNIYPVPNLNNPFLGVHYTLTHDQQIKLGPTATPAFWRENYSGFDRFNSLELLEILTYQSRLLLNNSFGFRQLAIEEMKKYYSKYFASLAKNLVHRVDDSLFNQKVMPGIRAQLLNTRTLKLENDFIIEGDKYSLHLLNAVSPAFTCSFALAEKIVDKIEQLKK